MKDPRTMTDVPRMPVAEDLPTGRQLARATAGAAGVAAAILIIAVLPAEYGIDPTGFGSRLGLTMMGEMKRETAAASPVAATVPSTQSAAGSPEAPRNETVRFTLAPGAGTEVKATMRAGQQFNYSWSTDGAEIRFELHGEETSAAEGDYTSYEKGTSKGETGTFRAPFDGTHGWYWRNRSDAPVTIEVRANGSYAKFAQLG